MEGNEKMWKDNTLNLTDFFIITPYGKNREGPVYITEEEFYEAGFLVKTESWDDIAQKINSFFVSAGRNNINTVLLYGYQGSGKTTFLHWFLKKSGFLEDYGKILLDLEPESNNANNINPNYVFDDYFRNEVCEFYANDPYSVVHVLKRLRNQFMRLNSTTFTRLFWEELAVLEDKFELLEKQNLKLNELLIFTNFLAKLDYTDTFLLFLLFYIKINDFNCKEKYGFQKSTNNVQRIIIIFDNIDGVRMEQTNARFPSKIVDLNVQFRKITSLLAEDSNIPQLNFIFSVRDYNHSLLELQNADMRQIEEIHFTPAQNMDIIMEKRIEIANNNENNRGQYVHESKMFSIFFNDAKFGEIFLPLFNYNMRKLALNFSSMCNEMKKKEINYFLNMKNKIENNNEMIGAYTNGLRGLFYSRIIRSLLGKDNLRSSLLYHQGEKIYINDEKKMGYNIKINPARILLTIIHSLTNYAEQKEIEDGEIIGLGDVYNDFRKIFKGNDFVDIFFDKLAELFLLHDKNWCHLITFRDKQVFDNKAFEGEKQKLKKMLTDGVVVNFSDLNNVKVKINKSAHVYLTKVAVHYEFYSMRVGNPGSLFIAIGDGEWSKNMNKVWGIVDPCLSSLINYLDGTDVENFEDTSLCLQDKDKEGDKKTSMAFRIIHTHLRYIDDFRKYMYYLSITERKSLKFEVINKDIIKCQQRYIDKLKQLCKARKEHYDDLEKKCSANVQKQQKVGYYQFVSLLD
jgi:hypothetical protein